MGRTLRTKIMLLPKSLKAKLSQPSSSARKKPAKKQQPRNSAARGPPTARPMDQCSRRYERLLDSVVLRRRRRRRRASQVLQSLRHFTEADGVVALASLKCDAPKLAQLDDFLDDLVLVLHNYLFSSNEHVVRVALDVVRSAVARRCHRLKQCNLEHLLGSLLRTLVAAPSPAVFCMARVSLQELLRAEPELTSSALAQLLGRCEARQVVEIYMQLIAYVLTSEDLLLSVLDRLVALAVRDLCHDNMAHRFCAFEAIYALHYRYLSRQDVLRYAEQISLPGPLVEALKRRLRRRYVPPLRADSLRPHMMAEPDFAWISQGLGARKSRFEDADLESRLGAIS